MLIPDLKHASSNPLIDCRPTAAFAKAHIKGATHIPASQLFMRMHELPKRSQTINLCGTDGTLVEAQAFLEERGYHIEYQYVWNETLEQALINADLLASGQQSTQLWQPAPLFKQFVEELMPRYNIQAGTGLDIACGAGRDMIYLAQHGWQMTGIDRSGDSLQRVVDLAHYNQVDVQTMQRNLETGEDPFTDITDHSIDLICVARYLHRPLFPYFKRLLNTGGVIIYQTFMEGSEKSTIGRPRNPNFLLKPNELAQIFSDAQRILWDEVELLEDGRPMSAFIAQY